MADIRYGDESEIHDVVQRFEDCEYKLEEFTHTRHLTVACWYLSTGSREQALVRMREGLRRFLAHHGKQGYHETITRFWLLLLGDFLEQCGGDALVFKINQAIERFGRKEILFTYYTRERALSEAAKQNWIEPDLQEFPCGRDRLVQSKGS